MMLRVTLQRGLNPMASPLAVISRGAATASQGKGKKSRLTFDTDVVTMDPKYVPRPFPDPIPDLMKPSNNYPSKAKPPAPERDLVNFPPPRMNEEVPPVSLGFIPRSFLEFFYPKTGVSGPWVFVGTVATFLVSKEWYVIEHEFWNGVGLIFIGTIAYQKFFPAVEKYSAEKQGLSQEQFEDLQYGTIENLEASIESEKVNQWQAQGQKILFDAKRENVGMQLEAAFRERQMAVYEEVKRRLDYQVEVQNAEGRIRQGHMTNWIVNQVNKALTPELEKAALKQCIADLKGLAKA